MKKYKSNLIMFLVLVAYFALVLFIYSQTFPSKIALVIGIPLAFIYSMVCFFSKRVRSGMTIWWGILSLGTGVLWIYFVK